MNARCPLLNATPYQSDVLLITTCGKLLNVRLRHHGFRWFYKVFRFTVFSLSRGTVAHGATYAAPMGKACFPLVL